MVNQKSWTAAAAANGEGTPAELYVLVDERSSLEHGYDSSKDGCFVSSTPEGAAYEELYQYPDFSIYRVLEAVNVSARDEWSQLPGRFWVDSLVLGEKVPIELAAGPHGVAAFAPITFLGTLEPDDIVRLAEVIKSWPIRGLTFHRDHFPASFSDSEAEIWVNREHLVGHWEGDDWVSTTGEKPLGLGIEHDLALFARKTLVKVGWRDEKWREFMVPIKTGLPKDWGRVAEFASVAGWVEVAQELLSASQYEFLGRPWRELLQQGMP